MKFLLCLASLPLCSSGLGAAEFDSNGIKIACTVQGSGSPVVLLHGLHGSGSTNWTLPGITAALAKNHRVIVMDARGHGDSDKPDAEAAYGTTMVGDVIALLDHFNIRQAQLVGYSMGGMIAMKTAVMHPDRVQSLLLCGMGWLREGSAQEAFWQNIPGLRGSASSAACMRGMARLAVTEAEVRALKMPAAIIVGDRDIVLPQYVVPLTKVRPDWPLTKIPDAGHITCIIKPEFRQAVVSAVESLQAR